MAGDANTPRKASAKLLATHIDAMKQVSGILVKATRAYKNPSAPVGSTQTDVAGKTGSTQPKISIFENGVDIPPDPTLSSILTEIGFDQNKPGGRAFLALLQCIRDNEENLKALEGELPE